MDKSPEDQPPQHVDEIAWMRELKHQREIDERLDWKKYYLQHPDYPGHANDNKRSNPVDLPKPHPEIDRALEGLLSARPEPKRETLLEKLKREAAERGEELTVKLQPQPERRLERILKIERPRRPDEPN